MGNYTDIEYEFVERTLALIAQYEKIMYDYPFVERYNHTLLINCLTGLVVMPKERTISAIPRERLLSQIKKEMGLKQTWINPEITTLRDFIINLRHAVAHFSIEVISRTDEFLVDEIVFSNPQRSTGFEIARFESGELLPFIRYYGFWLLEKLKARRSR